jgi:hypothetical protein
MPLVRAAGSGVIFGSPHAKNISGGSAMSFDSTMIFSTTMNRAEIEAMLGECRTFAAAADLPAVAQLLTDANGLPAAELGKRIMGCLEQLGGKDEYALLIDKLDMLLLNLPNLK